MIRQDYILRLVEQMTRILAQVLFFKRAKQVEDALDLLDEVGKLLGQQNSHDLIHQPPAALLALATHDGQLHGGFLLTLADLLFEAGLLEETEERSRHMAWSNALHLYLMLPKDPSTPFPMDLNDKIDRLLKRLAPKPLAPTLYPLLHTHFETRGDFAKAEDYLYHWAKADPAQAREPGFAFYDRLVSLSSSLLKAGHLPRTEVREGRKAWGNLY